MATPNSAAFFVPITKIAPTPEGHRLVTGTVSTERVDLDGQIADYDWAKKEAQAWFDIANVREQHSRNVVGKGLELGLDDTAKSITLTAKVVDPIAITKLDEGLFTGYSFGAKNVPGDPIKVIKDATAPSGRIVGGKWVEISLADRPANPDSVLSLIKSAGATLEVGEALGEFSEADVEKVAEPDEPKAPEAAPAAPAAEKQLTGDEAIHNAPLDAARAAIRQLIAQEAGEAEAGNTYQLGYLIDALQALDGFTWSEADEAYSAMVVEMAAVADAPTRRALYKDVAAALKKAVDDHKAKTPAAEPAVPEPTVPEPTPPPAVTEKVAEADDEKFLTADSMKAVLPDQLKAIMPELLKEHAEVLKEALADAFAGKELEKTVETLGKRAQPGGPVINSDGPGLRAIEKLHAVNAVVDRGDVPVEILKTIDEYEELTKSSELGVAQSARRMVAKLKAQHGIVDPA